MEVEAVVHVHVHIAQKLEVQVAEVQMHLYQMLRQVILLLLVQLKDFLVAVVQAQVDIILVVEEAEEVQSAPVPVLVVMAHEVK